MKYTKKDEDKYIEALDFFNENKSSKNFYKKLEEKYKDKNEYYIIAKITYEVFKNRIKNALDILESQKQLLQTSPFLSQNYSMLSYWRKDCKNAIEYLKLSIKICEKNHLKRILSENLFILEGYIRGYSFSSRKKEVDTIFFKIPNYSERNQKDRLELSDEIKKIGFRTYLINLIVDERELSKYICYFENYKKEMKFIIKTNDTNAYLISIRRDIEEANSVLDLTKKLLESVDIINETNKGNIFCSFDESVVDFYLLVEKNREEEFLKILEDIGCFPSTTLLYKINSNNLKIKLVKELTNRKVLTLSFLLKDHKKLMFDEKNNSGLEMHLFQIFQNYDIVAMSEYLTDVDYQIKFLVKNIDDAIISLQNYFYRETKVEDIDFY